MHNKTKQWALLSITYTLISINIYAGTNMQTYNQANKNTHLDNTQQAGSFHAKDKTGTPVILEWQKATLFAPEFLDTMKKVWPIACAAYTPVEMNFLRIFPQVVGTEPYYKIFEPLFKDGVDAIDWSKVETVVQESLKPHFIYDTSTWGPEAFTLFGKDICDVITVKDQNTNTLLGFSTFMLRDSYAFGNIKMMHFAVNPTSQNRGLGKLLMSSILKINPSIKRISLHTRTTNTTALKTYKKLGLTKDDNPIMDYPTNLEHWIFWEYRVGKQNNLEKIADMIKSYQ